MTIIVITGIQAAGKSTVAQSLAERFDRSVHLRGDIFRRMIVNGRMDMGPADPPAEAIAQLRMRHRLTALAADAYADAGFTVVLQDVIIGRHLAELITAVKARPLFVVVLAPSVAVVQAREQARRLGHGKVAYKPGDLTAGELDAVFRRDTPPVGLWLDTSGQTVTETVQEILNRYLAEAGVTSAMLSGGCSMELA